MKIIKGIQYYTRCEYMSLHFKLRKTFEKSGVCRFCKRERKTEFALKTCRHYSFNRDNYIELCRGCHKAYDFSHEDHKVYKQVHELPKDGENITLATYTKAGVVSLQE